MNQNHTTQDRYIGQSELSERTGLSPNTIRSLEKAGKFPERKRVGFRAVRWWLPDVMAWEKNPEGWKNTA